MRAETRPFAVGGRERHRGRLACRRSRAPRRAGRRTSPSPLGKVRAHLRAGSHRSCAAMLARAPATTGPPSTRCSMRCCRVCRRARRRAGRAVGPAGERQEHARGAARRGGARTRRRDRSARARRFLSRPRATRAALARDVHPLLATRGVPGTHDVALLDRHASRARATHRREIPARIPRFDKGRDTRLAPSRWRRVASRPAADPARRLVHRRAAANRRARSRAPPTHSNASKTPTRRWRILGQRASRRRIRGALAPPRRADRARGADFDVVARWRDEPERALRRRGAPRAHVARGRCADS